MKILLSTCPFCLGLENHLICLVKPVISYNFLLQKSHSCLFESLAFMVEARNGDLEVARLLIQKGANVNCQNNWKSTPLHMASRNGDLEVPKLLIQKGAYVNFQDNCKNTPLHLV